jgi:hypothetical protein
MNYTERLKGVGLVLLALFLSPKFRLSYNFIWLNNNLELLALGKLTSERQ